VQTESFVSDKSLVEVMRTLRGVRHFSDRPVPHAVIREILELATKAGNDRNLQDWRFVVVRDAELRKRVGEIYLDALLAYHKVPTAEAALAKAGLPAMQRDSLNMALRMAEAPPVLILACYHQTSGLDPGMSLLPAVQNLMLAAWSFGLGTVMTTVAAMRRASAAGAPRRPG
jgi:nitroreductase